MAVRQEGSRPPRADRAANAQRGHLDGKPMSAAVYESIRDAIVDGRYGPESQLVQEQIAEELGVSRTPVRDALNRLAHEGLVTAVLGRGYLVNELADQDINDMFQVRERLEVLALELACGRLSRAQVARIQALIEEMDEADPSDAALQYELNRQFHQAMIEPCGNRLLLGLLNQLWDAPVSRRITRSYVHDQANVHLMISEHRAILDASVAGDCERLVALSTAHMTTGYGETLSDPKD